MSWRWRGDGGGSNGRRWLLPVAASSSSCCLLLSLPLSCVYSVLCCSWSGGGGRWSGKRLGGEMTMILGGGTTVFSSPPLCRARDLCFFFPLCSFLFLFSLSGSAGIGSVDGGGMAVLDSGGRMAVLVVDGDARRRFCPFSALCFFFFSVFLLLPVSVSCSSVSSSSFFLLEDGSRCSCCGATGRNGGSSLPSSVLLFPSPLYLKKQSHVWFPFPFCFLFSFSSFLLFVPLSLLFISRKRRSPPCSVPSWCRGETGCLTSAG